MTKIALVFAAGSLVSFFGLSQTKTVGWDLDKCLAYAVEHNITLQQAALTKTSADLDFEQSKMNRFPNLFASGSQALTNGRSIDPITSDFVSQTIHSTSLSLNSQMTLYNGGKLNNQIKQQELVTEQKSLYVEEAKNSIVLSIVEAYVLAEYYFEGTKAAENTISSAQRQLDQAKGKLQAGSVSVKDVADLQSLLAQNQYSLLQAQNQYSQQLLALKQLLELEPGVPFDILHDELKSDIELIPDKLTVYSLALGTMPEIKAAELQQNVAELDEAIARSGYLPSLSLSGSLSTGYTNTQQTDFSDQMSNNFNQRLGITVSVPIYSRKQNKTNVEKAQISKESAELQLISERKELYRKIETAWQNATSAKAEMVSAQAALDAAQVAYDLAQEQFTRGAIDPVNLAVSQNTWFSAKQSFLQAKYKSILYVRLLNFYQDNGIKE